MRRIFLLAAILEAGWVAQRSSTSGSSSLTRVSVRTCSFAIGKQDMFPPTAELGVLDEFSKPDKWFDKIKIRRRDHVGVFFAYV